MPNESGGILYSKTPFSDKDLPRVWFCVDFFRTTKNKIKSTVIIIDSTILEIIIIFLFLFKQFSYF
jgi:hypothetical protein